MSGSLLEISGLTCRHGDRVAVAGLHLTVAQGELLGLLGPNGAGKSTVLRALCGLHRPAAGTLRLGGGPFRPERAEDRYRIGVVFQDPSLDEQLTGRENLRLLGTLYGIGGAERERRVDEVLRLVDLTGRQHDLVRTYSGGMKRRLELGRVLLHQPELLLLDEPSRGLDPVARGRYFAELRRWQRERGLSALLATHLDEEAAECDRIAVLDEGHVIAVETREALMARVGGDVIVIEADEAKALAEELRPALAESGAEVTGITDGELTLCAPRAQALVPRLLTAAPPGRLRSLSLRRPSLADVFAKLTGKALTRPPRQEAAFG